jgi:hypothetical protein
VSQEPARTPTFNGAVWTAAYDGNTVYVGGDFTEALIGGRRVPRLRLAAINARTGALLPWAPKADGQVKSIVATGGYVYAAGQFSTINSIDRDSLARIDDTSGTLHDTFKHTIIGRPYALAAGSGRLYVGGAFTSVDGRARTRLAAFSLSTGALDGTWRPSADDQVESLAATSGRIYIGGKFHEINGVDGSRRLAAVSPTSGKVVSGFRPRAAYITYGMAVTSSGMYATHGGPGGRVTAYGLSGTARWTLTMDGDPQAVAVLDGVVYIGGHFDNICRSSRTGDQGACLDGNVPRVKLAAANDRGQVLSWKANGNGVTGVHTVAASGGLGKLAAGGAFTTINGAAQRRFAQFD